MEFPHRTQERTRSGSIALVELARMRVRGRRSPGRAGRFRFRLRLRGYGLRGFKL